MTFTLFTHSSNLNIHRVYVYYVTHSSPEFYYRSSSDHLDATSPDPACKDLAAFTELICYANMPYDVPLNNCQIERQRRES